MTFNHDVTIAAIELYPLSTRGGVSPNMALGQMRVRPALLVKLIADDGCFGWGEIWANFPPRANLHKAHLVEDVVATKIIGHRFAEPAEMIEYLRAKLAIYFLHIGQDRVFEHILAGLDTAAWDLCLRNAGLSFTRFMHIDGKAQCYASSVNRPDLSKRLGDHAELGQSEFKLKIGFNADDDVAFVDAAARQLPAGARLMIDSNQCWSPTEAASILQRLEDYDLLFAEEPIRADLDPDAWVRLASQTSIPLAGGENLYGLDQFLKMANAGVRVLQPDVAKWGGVTGALELAKAMPEECVLWPHFMGSGVGQQAGLAVSAALGPTSKCEMDVNENPLRGDLCAMAIKVEEGQVLLSDEPGLLSPPTELALQIHTSV